MRLIEALGLDLRIFLAQLFNFAVLVLVLWRFAYKPLSDILESRRKKIEQGVKDAEAAAKKLEKSAKEGKQMVALARKEATAIVEESRSRAEAQYQKIIEDARLDWQSEMTRERQKIESEKNAAMVELKHELSGLVVSGLEKFLAEKMDKDKDAAIVNKMIKELSE